MKNFLLISALAALLSCGERDADADKDFLYPLNSKFEASYYRQLGSERWISTSGLMEISLNINNEYFDSGDEISEEDESISMRYLNFTDTGGNCTGNYSAGVIHSSSVSVDDSSEDEGSYSVFDPYVTEDDIVVETESDESRDVAFDILELDSLESGAILGVDCPFSVYDNFFVAFDFFRNGELIWKDYSRNLEYLFFIQQ